MKWKRDIVVICCVIPIIILYVIDETIFLLLLLSVRCIWYDSILLVRLLEHWLHHAFMQADEISKHYFENDEIPPTFNLFNPSFETCVFCSLFLFIFDRPEKLNSNGCRSRINFVIIKVPKAVIKMWSAFSRWEYVRFNLMLTLKRRTRKKYHKDEMKRKNCINIERS